MKKSPLVKETKKNSTKEKALPTIRKHGNDLDMFYSFRQVPITVAQIERIALDLIAWSDKNDSENDLESLRLSEFIDSHRLHMRTYYEWLDKFEILRDAHEYAKRRIGARRERGAIKKKYDGSFIARSIGHYLPEYREEAEFMASLKSPESAQEGGAVFNITIPAAKDTGIKKAGGEENDSIK